jgi:hypothetical protein
MVLLSFLALAADVVFKGKIVGADGAGGAILIQQNEIVQSSSLTTSLVAVDDANDTAKIWIGNLRPNYTLSKSNLGWGVLLESFLARQ